MGATVTNLNYGGLNPRVTRVISVHGGLDPWHAAGLQKDVNADAPVIIVPREFGCETGVGDPGCFVFRIVALPGHVFDLVKRQRRHEERQVEGAGNGQDVASTILMHTNVLNVTKFLHVINIYANHILCLVAIEIVNFKRLGVWIIE